MNRKFRRYRVAVRAKVRSRRRAQTVAAGAVLALGVAAALVARRLPRERIDAGAVLRGLPAPHSGRAEGAVVRGAPPALEGALAAAAGLDGKRALGLWEPYRLARRLKTEFPCLREVRVGRSWRGRGVTLEVSLRRPVARVLREGAAWGWLGEDGALYPAPEGTYPPGPLPAVELAGPPDGARPALAQFLEAAAKAGGLRSPVRRVEYRPGEEGWEVALADGTRLLWGNLNWTEEKLLRLREVLADLGVRADRPGLVADLRCFEDGKILVRPGGGASDGRAAHGEKT